MNEKKRKYPVVLQKSIGLFSIMTVFFILLSATTVLATENYSGVDVQKGTQTKEKFGGGESFPSILIGHVSRHSSLSLSELITVFCSYRVYDFGEKKWSLSGSPIMKANSIIRSWLDARYRFGWNGNSFEYRPSLCIR